MAGSRFRTSTPNSSSPMGGIPNETADNSAAFRQWLGLIGLYLQKNSLLVVHQKTKASRRTLSAPPGTHLGRSSRKRFGDYPGRSVGPAPRTQRGPELRYCPPGTGNPTHGAASTRGPISKIPGQHQ